MKEYGTLRGMATCSECTKDLSIEKSGGHGKCNTCYQRWRRTSGTVKATCHPDRAHYAKGMCDSCYRKQPSMRAKSTAGERAYREAHPNQYRTYYRRAARKRNGHAEVTDERKVGACEVCTTHANPLRLDHDHATGARRGWLCSNCNVALGMLKDDPDRIKGLLSYLSKHQGPL